MPAVAIRVRVVWVALCLDDAKDNADNARTDDAHSETRIGRPKQLHPVVQRIVRYVYEGHVAGNALCAQRALPLAGNLATHAWYAADLLEVCAVKNHVQTRGSSGLLLDIRWWRRWRRRRHLVAPCHSCKAG